MNASNIRLFAKFTTIAALISLFTVSHVAAQDEVVITPIPVDDDPCWDIIVKSSVSFTANGRFVDFFPTAHDRLGAGTCRNYSPGDPYDFPRDSYRYDAQTGQSERLTPDPAIPGVSANYSSTREDGRYTVFIGTQMSSSPRTSRYYIKDWIGQTVVELPVSVSQFRNTSLDWLPDQDQVRLHASAEGNGTYTDTIFNVDAGTVETVTRDVRDGVQYYGHERNVVRGGETGLQIEHLPSGTLTPVDTSLYGRRLTDLGGAAVSKDGRFAVWRGMFNGLHHILRTNLLTNETIEIANSRSGESPRISADGRYIVFSQTASRVDPNSTDSQWWRGIALYDSVSNTTRMLTEGLCDNYPRGFSSGIIIECSVSGPIVGMSDDASKIVFLSLPGQAPYVITPKLIEINQDDAPADPYTDVPTDFWGRDAIVRFDRAGIAGACNASPRQFCPLNALRHDVSALWFVKAVRGADFRPVAGTGTRFTDVPSTSWAVDWIEEIDRLGIDRGFGSVFRPDRTVNRAQFAYFLVRAKYGVDFVPPAASGNVFADVPATHWAARYIEQLHRDSIIIKGCNGSEVTFCPGAATNRATAAKLFVTAFEL